MALSIASDRIATATQALESIKWVALAAMLTEHLAHYAFGITNGWPFVVGRLAFPLFTIALAIGCAHKTIPELREVIVRLCLWGIAAGVAGLLVRDVVPLNVLFTFALGASAHALARGTQGSRWLLLAGTVVVASLVEYGVLGVCAVAVAMHGARIEKPAERAAWLLFALLLIAAKQYNASAILAIPLTVLLIAARVEMPRQRGLFYYAYVAQWPLLAGVAWLVAR